MNNDSRSLVTDVASLEVMDILKLVLTERTPPGKGPEEPVATGERPMEIVTSPKARCLYYAYEQICALAQRLSDEHSARHPAPVAKPEKCCDEQVQVNFIQTRRIESFFGLGRQIISEEHPWTFTHHGDLRQGWQLVRLDNVDEASLPIQDKNSLLLRIIPAITKIAQGIDLSPYEDGLGPVGKDERVVTAIQDERIQCLHGLSPLLDQAYSRELPEGLKSGGPEKTNAYFNKLPPDKQHSYRLLQAHYQRLATAVTELAWCAIRDDILRQDVKPPLLAGVRRSWEIVERAPRPGEIVPVGDGTVAIY